jgi:hypothetical protein
VSQFTTNDIPFNGMNNTCGDGVGGCDGTDGTWPCHRPPPASLLAGDEGRFVFALAEWRQPIATQILPKCAPEAS